METQTNNKKTMKSCIITLVLMIAGMGSITYGYDYSDYTWHEYNGHSNWAQAEAWANEVGGHLVVINDASENAWLSETFKGTSLRGEPYLNGLNSLVWIGLECVGDNKANLSNWQWITGESLSYSASWYVGTPRYDAGGGNHAYLHTDTHFLPGTWWNNIGIDNDGFYNPLGVIEIEAEPLVVEVDIKPGSCPNPLNVKSKGVLPVAILGSEDFDVFSIDPVSIRLEGVAPVRSSYEDVATPVSNKTDDCECTTEGPDGYLDLVLKFDTQEIVDALGGVYDGDVYLLTLTGKAVDGTPIEGTDCVIIIAKK